MSQSIIHPVMAMIKRKLTRDMSQEADSCFIVNADSMRHSIPVSGSHVGTGQSGGGKCHKFTL